MDASKEIKSMKLCKLTILPVFGRFDYTEMCKRNVCGVSSFSEKNRRRRGC